MPRQYEELFQLDDKTKYQLAHQLLESLSSETDAIEVQAWQEAELLRREQDAIDNPDDVETWEEAKEKIRKSIQS